jgi:hypothetical protein
MNMKMSMNMNLNMNKNINNKMYMYICYPSTVAKYAKIPILLSPANKEITQFARNPYGPIVPVTAVRILQVPSAPDTRSAFS